MRIGIYLLLLTLPFAGAVRGDDLGYPNRYGSMAESFVDMMDAFSSAWNKRRGDSSRQDESYRYPSRQPNYPDSYMGGGYMPTPPSPPRQYLPRNRIDTRLDGSWQGLEGDVLVIRRGRFRIYRDRNNYREGHLRLQDNYLSMQDPASGLSRNYEFAESEGRLVLRDEEGNMLLYRRMGR